MLETRLAGQLFRKTCTGTGRAFWAPYNNPIRRHSTSASGLFAAYFSSNQRWSNISARTDALPLPAFDPVPPSALRPLPTLTPSRLITTYSQLSKSHLTTLVVLTAMAPVALSPLPASVTVLLATGAGTALCSASANALNELQEAPFDAQMGRTRGRPLVRRIISPTHAALFAAGTGIAGPAILWGLVNPTTALLGAANIVLYAGVYTAMKRFTVWNTWVGSVVGAIPPLMGWTAVGGHLLPSADHPVTLFLPQWLSSAPMPDLTLVDNPLAPLALFLLMYHWQFPHFNALAHFVRNAYAQGGYHMLSILDPRRNALVSLRHTALLAALCTILVPLSGLTTWTFALTSAPAHAVLLQAAWKFYKQGGEAHARKLFHHSLWYLPVVLGLMMAHKQGMEWTSWVGMGGEEKAEEESKKGEVESAI